MTLIGSLSIIVSMTTVAHVICLTHLLRTRTRAYDWSLRIFAHASGVLLGVIVLIALTLSTFRS